jgi:hypothetical protein
MSEPDLDAIVEAFRGLINAAWPHVARAQSLSAYDHVVGDWLQATWECVVEAALVRGTPVYLPSYGEGADCGDDDRVFEPGAHPTHRILCVPRGGGSLRDLLNDEAFDRPEGAELDELVTMVDGWYYRQPPFDCVLLEGDQRRVVRLSDVHCELRPVAPEPIPRSS